MYKWDLEKAEGPEIKLRTFVESWRNQGSSRKSTSSSLTMLKPLTLWIIKKLWKILKEIEVSDHYTFLLRNLYAGQEATVRTAHGITAAKSAKSLQSCLTLCDPTDSSLHPWDSPGKNTGVGCHFLLQCMKVKSESEVAQGCPTLSDLMDRSLPGSSVHGIFQARYWSGVPLPSPME